MCYNVFLLNLFQRAALIWRVRRRWVAWETLYLSLSSPITLGVLRFLPVNINVDTIISRRLVSYMEMCIQLSR